jgi:hypothetical protein
MSIQSEFVKQKAAQPEGFKSVIIHKAFQLSASAGMPQFSKGFGFYLSNAFSGYAEIPSHFFQGMVCLFTNAETHAKDFFFPRCQGG